MLSHFLSFEGLVPCCNFFSIIKERTSGKEMTERLFNLLNSSPSEVSDFIKKNIASNHAVINELAEFLNINQSKLANQKLLYAIAKKAPEALFDLVELTKMNEYFKSQFLTAFTDQDDDGNNILHILIENTSATTFSIFIKLAETNTNVMLAIAKTLASQNKSKWAPFDLIVTKNSTLLPILFEITKSNLQVQHSLVDALSARDLSNWTGFHTLVRYAYQHLPKLFELSQIEMIRTCLAKSLIKKNDNQSSGYSFIEKYCPLNIEDKLINDLINMANELRKILTETEWKSFLESDFNDFVIDTIIPEDYEKFLDRKTDIIAVGVWRSQNRINAQLVTYLRKINKPETLLLAEAIEKNEGLCCGFSICDSLMHHVKKSSWWSEIQRITAETKIDDSSDMKKLYYLPDGDKQLILHEIFEKALNFIVFNQSTIFKGYHFEFLPNDINQNNFLSTFTPGKHQTRLEITVNNEVKTVQSNDQYAGYFDKTELLDFLNNNKTIIQHSVCLIGPMKHACALNADETYWYLRNCNRRNGSPYKINLTATADLVEIIYKRLGNNLFIKIASLEEKSIKLNKTNVSFIINNKERIKNHLNINCLSNMFLNSTSEEIVLFLQKIRHNSEHKKEFSNLLTQKYENRFNLFHVIHDKDIFSELISWIKDDDDYFRTQFLIAFVSQESMNGFTGLHKIASFAPNALLSLLEYIKTDKSFYKIFSNALRLSSNDKWTGLHSIGQHAPKALSALLEIIKIEGDFCDNFSAALQMQNNNNWTVLHEIIHVSPDILPDFIEIIKKNEALHISFLNAFCLPNNSKEVALHLLAKKAPDALLMLIDLAKTDKQMAIAIAKTLGLKNHDTWTPLDYIIIKSAASLPALFELAKTNSEVRCSLSKTLNIVDSDNWTVFHTLARYAPTYLPNLLDLTTFENIRSSVATALIAKNNDQLTSFCFLKKYCPSDILSKLEKDLINMAKWLSNNLTDNEWYSFLNSDFGNYIKDTLTVIEYKNFIDRRPKIRIAELISRSDVKLDELLQSKVLFFYSPELVKNKQKEKKMKITIEKEAKMLLSFLK